MYPGSVTPLPGYFRRQHIPLRPFGAAPAAKHPPFSCPAVRRAGWRGGGGRGMRVLLSWGLLPLGLRGDLTVPNARVIAAGLIGVSLAVSGEMN